MEETSINRCAWAGSDPLYRAYHDLEWGVPVHDDRLLFEFLILEGAQAGLSWITILKKRDNFRRAFDGFEPEKIARYGARQKTWLMNDAGIVRNRQKIDGAVLSARAYLDIREAGTNFSDFLWGFTGGKVLQHRGTGLGDIPALTGESKAMSKALIERGFKFVGPTICYAFMQAVGMVNDHTVGCFRYPSLVTSHSSRSL